MKFDLHYVAQPRVENKILSYTQNIYVTVRLWD